MFQKGELKRLAPLLVFFGAYSLLFLLWVKTFSYSLPFLLGLLIAAAVQPVVAFLEKRCGCAHGAASALAAGAALLLVLTAVGLVGYYGVKEAVSFLVKASTGGFPEFSPPVKAFFLRVGDFFEGLDMDFLRRNQEELMELLKSSMNLVLSFLGALLGLVTSLPTVLTLLLTAGFSTFCFSRDMGKLRAFSRRLLSDSAAGTVKSGLENSSGTGRRYFLSYLFLYFITFCETCVILSLLGLPYPLTVGLITAAADLLPVLGPGIVFTPLAVYQLLIGEYGKALGLFIGWLVITCIRQVTEPKLVASTAKVHPLAMLAAVYFSLVSGSFWTLLYIMGLCMLYAFLREAGAQVLGIVSIFTYGMKKGLDRLAAADVKNVSLTNFDVIAQAAADEGYIKPEDIARILAFRDNPSDESWIGRKD